MVLFARVFKIFEFVTRQCLKWPLIFSGSITSRFFKVNGRNFKLFSSIWISKCSRSFSTLNSNLFGIFKLFFSFWTVFGKVDVLFCIVIDVICLDFFVGFLYCSNRIWSTSLASILLAWDWYLEQNWVSCRESLREC